MSFFRKLYTKTKHTKNRVYCDYKGKPCIHYETKQKAEHALKFINEYENQNYVPKRVYHCKCGYWHLTSKPLLGSKLCV